MLPSLGFEKGLIGQGRGKLTDVGRGGNYEVTCPTGHVEVGNGTVTDQASLLDSYHDLHDGCMHALQSVVAGGDSDTLHVGNLGNAGEVGEVVHNRVHYYIHVPNSKESTYQACDRNV